MRKIFATITLALLVSIPLKANANGVFKDVPLESSHYPYIYTLSNENIITGYSNNTFKPGESVSKKQAAVLVFRALQLEPFYKYSHTYADVSKSNSAYHEIHTLMEMGIFPKNRNFFPSVPLKRDAMASLISLSFELQGKKQYTFPDVKKTDTAYIYINNLANYGITTNHTDTNFNPKSNVTRAQFASFLGRSLAVKYKYLRNNDTGLEVDEYLNRGTRIKIVGEKGDNYIFTYSSDEKLYEVPKRNVVDHALYFPNRAYMQRYVSSFAGLEYYIQDGIDARSIGSFIIEGEFNLSKFPSLGKQLGVSTIDYGQYYLYSTSTIDTLTKLYFNRTLPRANAPLNKEWEETYPIYKYSSKGYQLLFGDKGSYPFDIEVEIKDISRYSDNTYIVKYEVFQIWGGERSSSYDERYEVKLGISDEGRPYIMNISTY